MAVVVVVVGNTVLGCQSSVQSVDSFSHPDLSSGRDPLPPD